MKILGQKATQYGPTEVVFPQIFPPLSSAGPSRADRYQAGQFLQKSAV